MDSIFQFVLNHFHIIELIVFWYPVTMSLLWMVGSIIYYFRIERKDPLPLPATPMVSILVPAFNESANLVEVIKHLNEMNYPEYEIIIINDGSTDDTMTYAKALTEKYERVRCIDLQENCGKANALYLGFMASKGEYLVCVDGDSYLDKDCIRYMMAHFLNANNGERVGAVTGNPRVRNRSSLLAKIQLCEYASIISMIKRTQRIWGKVMTVSGVVVAYRKQALLDCGLWDRDMVTEDIAVTWKLERNFWDIRYEPNALCWMLVPESIKGLIKQRKRWARGGQEVIFRHVGIFKSWRRRRMYPVYLEQVLSLIWVLLWLLLTITEIFKLCYNVGSYTPYLWKSQYLAVICMIQFVVALCLERQYDKGIFKYMISVAWYPVIYWIVNGLVALMALPGTLFKKKKKLATWNSPDRGIATSSAEMAASQAEDESSDAEHNPGEEQAQPVQTSSADADADMKESSHTTRESLLAAGEEQEDDTDNSENNIIDGKQVWWKKIIEYILSGLAWMFILSYLFYVIYGFICLAVGKTPFTCWIYTVEMLQETKKLLFITFVILLIEIVVMIFWKEYNRLKYGSLRRRKFKPDASVEEMAEFFEMPQEKLLEMRSQKIITLPQNIISKDFKAVRKKLYGTENKK